MINTVIDANIIQGYFKEFHLGIDSGLTDSTEFINNDEILIYLDNKNDHIKKEWESLVGEEWVKSIIIEWLDQCKLLYIDVNSHYNLISKLKKAGFPSSKDVWYIRTAKEVAVNHTSSIIVTEDIDFFDPTKKKSHGKARQTILKSKSCFHKNILKKENICIMCVFSISKIV